MASKKLASMAEYRKKVYGEILETEEAYVADLNILCDQYLDPIKSFAPADMQGLLNVICASASMLRDFHNTFLSELSSEGVSQKILATFEDKIPYFRMYSSYCANYAGISEAVDAHKRENEKFASRVQNLSKQEGCRGLSFGSFLIKPVQRICKYQLFFRDLLKHVSPKNPNNTENKLHTRILKIKSAVEEVSKEVNDKMFDMQRRSDAIAAYKKMVPDSKANKGEFENLVSKPHRLLISEIDLEVKVLCTNKRAPQFRKYCGFVFNDVLVLAKKEKKGGIMKSSKKGELKFRYIIPFEESKFLSDTSLKSPTNGDDNTIVEEEVELALCKSLNATKADFILRPEENATLMQIKSVIQEAMEKYNTHLQTANAGREMLTRKPSAEANTRPIQNSNTNSSSKTPSNPQSLSEQMKADPPTAPSNKPSTNGLGSKQTPLPSTTPPSSTYIACLGAVKIPVRETKASQLRKQKLQLGTNGKVSQPNIGEKPTAKLSQDKPAQKTVRVSSRRSTTPVPNRSKPTKPNNATRQNKEKLKVQTNFTPKGTTDSGNLSPFAKYVKRKKEKKQKEQLQARKTEAKPKAAVVPKRMDKASRVSKATIEHTSTDTVVESKRCETPSRSRSFLNRIVGNKS